MGKGKPRVRLKGKSYSWDQSPLYRLRSKKRLCKLLQLDLIALRQLCEGDWYREQEVGGSSGKSRTAQIPVGALDEVHTRIASFMRRVRTPDYLFSGVRGRSAVDNAKAHLGAKASFHADIEKFYPSISQKAVFNFFYSELECSCDVAGILASLLCRNGHLPTGSRASMVVAFWCSHSLFDALDTYAQSHGLKMTVYVDDITFSGQVLPSDIERNVRQIVTKAGYGYNASKSRILGDVPRRITGVIVRGNELLLPNRQHKAIHEQFVDLEQGDGSRMKVRQLAGRLAAAGQIMPIFRRRATTFTQAHSHHFTNRRLLKK